MNELQIFQNPEFGDVRTISIDGEPWLVGKDVADNLGYQNGSRDINRHVDEEDRRKDMISDGTQLKETILINESGLYSLVLSSKLPTAKKFKRWVTHEVIPAIRKTGGYHVPQSPAEQMAQGILAAQKLLAERDATIAKQNEQIAVLTPKRHLRGCGHGVEDVHPRGRSGKAHQAAGHRHRAEAPVRMDA